MTFFGIGKTNFPTTVALLFWFNFIVAGNDPLIETAEALLAVAKQQKGYSNFDYEDSQDPAKISQTVAVEREVNRGDFTGMLVETNRDEFLKLCEKCKSYLEKWTGIEKALIEEKPVEDKPADSSDKKPNFLKKLDEKKDEPKSEPTPASTPPFSLFKKEEEKSARKPIDDIKPPLIPSLNLKFESKSDGDKAATPPAITPAPTETPKDAEQKPPFGLKKLTLPSLSDKKPDSATATPTPSATPKPEDKPAENNAEKKDDKKPEDEPKPFSFKMRTLRPLGRKTADDQKPDDKPTA